jgi:hypothetical protein
MFEADAAMKLIVAEIGEPGEDFNGSTLWESIGKVGDQITPEEKLQEYVTMHMEQSQAHVQSLLKMVWTENAESNLEEKIRATLSNIGTSFQNLVDTVNIQKVPTPTSPSTMSGYQYGSIYASTASVDQTAALDAKVARLESQLTLLLGGGAPGLAMTQTQPVAALSPLAAHIPSAALEDTLLARLKDQDNKIKLLERKFSGDQAFKADDRTYSCMEDVVNLITDNSITRIGGFIDMFAAFVLMVSPPCTGEQHANRVISSSKASRGAAESDLLATLTHERPPFLFQVSGEGKTVKLAPKANGFGGNMKKFEDYDETSNLVKDQIFTMMQDLVTTLTSDLDFSQPGDRLISCMVRKSHTFAVRLLNFFTTFYRTLVIKCCYPKANAWRLAGRVEDIRLARSKATIIWTMMQSLNAVKEILEKEVQSHPVVMKEIREFQLEHRVDSSQLSKLAEELKTAKNQFKEVTTAMGKADKQGDSLAEKVTKLGQDLGNLKTEVKRIATKVPP